MTSEEHFLSKPYGPKPDSGVLAYQAPSNIALVKYWGKYGDQLPKNASISFTLDHCVTQTHLHFKKKETSGFSIAVLFDGQPQPSFVPKIQQFFDRIVKYMPLLEAFHFDIKTTNTFPHSSGIASSASGMAALTGALLALENSCLKVPLAPSDFEQKASFLARLGSGSAARSIQGPMVVWGKHPHIPESDNLFGTLYQAPIDPVFRSFQDTILLVDEGEKVVSSTVGHALMHDHPYAQSRFDQAQKHLADLMPILASGDLLAFSDLVEREALALHAMMLTSDPSFILMKPNTLSIIEAIRRYRAETGHPVCFTLDAGANVHVLYPEQCKSAVLQFIEQELKGFCSGGRYITDRVGHGLKKL
ncbi:MAG: diphosphomevalonate decarboxylase [Flavobacteriaceae bacterium]|jgi:diphosphomevalonate decarboxylase|nr:diphosphomevalonate decarboxylase [Flavobacteriaceae bacterium]